MAKVEFDLDGPLRLAEGHTHHDVLDMHLLIIGARPTWMALDDPEYRAFKALFGGATVRHVLAQHGASVVQRLLAKIHQARFYEQDVSCRRSFPPKLTLYITNRCNLRCVHCYADAGETLADELTTEEWLAAIAQYSGLVDSGEVTISGGEPTLHGDLGTLLGAIAEHGHRSVLFTNGTTQGGKLGWHRLAEMIDVVQLSIDGFRSAVNDSIRGAPTFNKVLSTYRIFYPTNVQIRVSVSVMPQNVASLREELLPFLKQYDPEKKIGLILSPTVVAGRNASGEFAFDYPELQEAMGDVLDEIWRSGWRFPNTFQRNDHQPRCGIGSSILIAPHGGFRACTFAPVSGNLRDESLLDWHSRTQEHLGQYDVDEIPMCQNCDLRHVCLGGCVVKMNHRARCTGAGPCTPENRLFYYEKLVRESRILFGEQSPLPLQST